MDETDGLVADEVVYDLADWEPELRATLDRLLDGEGVAHRWGQQSSPTSWMTPDAVSGPASPPFTSTQLVVAERDADLVEELIDELDHPDALEVEDDDGDDGGAEVMSALYITADMLASAPGNTQAAEELLEVTHAAGEVTVPYGLDPAVWTELVAMAERLAGCLREGADEDEVIETARLLRDALHPLV